MSTKAIFDQARAQLDQLERLISRRRNRDRACMTLTDLHVSVEALAHRLAGLEFSPAPVNHEEEEPRAEFVDGLTLAELMEAPADDLEREAADEEGIDVRELRLRYFRLFLDYQVAGCGTIDEVVRKVLAFARRFRPQIMTALGLSMSDVGRLLGDSRAKVHAREKRLVEEPLKRIGARGFHGLGGQRSEEARQKCREAQQGNRNRRNGEQRKRGAA
jgi:hypothetical protein